MSHNHSGRAVEDVDVDAKCFVLSHVSLNVSSCACNEMNEYNKKCEMIFASKCEAVNQCNDWHFAKMENNVLLWNVVSLDGLPIVLLSTGMDVDVVCFFCSPRGGNNPK